ncbi:2-hydroxyglutaryl-CoA dehydratase [candidate division WOR-3 bacterium]|nr:2-hydroxyglutaryl-CoA dehydratase [candidate division WOR-3 bacterium]
MRNFLGIDIGSISTKGVVIDDNYRVLSSSYLYTKGRPIKAIKNVLKDLDKGHKVSGAGTTGSARRLAGVMINADVIKNEIIAHALAATQFYLETKTVIEIGGQDSKIIILRNGIPIDFAMNTVCAAGTGSFLEHQASRLGIPIEEFGELALKSENRVKIAGRCTVFAESDMVHKAQLGVPTEDIIRGLCDAIVRNFLNVVAKGKEIHPLILFQGGVAANIGVKKAFEEVLETEVVVPEYYHLMGAIGAAILAKKEVNHKGTKFSGFSLVDIPFSTRLFECDGCPNMCEIVEILKDGRVIDRYGDRCGKWQII